MPRKSTATPAYLLFDSPSGSYPPQSLGFIPEKALKKSLSTPTRLNSGESNSAFGKLRTPKTIREWFAMTPLGSCVCIKAPLRSTHLSRLVALELRYPGWLTPEAYSLLTAHKAALCIAAKKDLQPPKIHTAATRTRCRLRRTGFYQPRKVILFAQRFAALISSRDISVHLRAKDETAGVPDSLAFERAAARVNRR